jgi:uncharacterized protein YidB (DUF937 family)
MSMLNTILGQITGSGSGQQAYQQQNQQQHNLLESIAGLLCSPEVGGIGGLAALFQKQGLGNIVAGWIGRGPNPPVSSDQVEQVLGSQQIAAVARKLGMDPTQASAHLAAVLPHAVDHLTPDGTIPSESCSAQDMLSSLKKKFMGA